MESRSLSVNVRVQFLSSLCLIWLGMVLAISFLEAPVKFQAPSLTREVALDVGRTVFTAFHIVQAVIAAIALGLGVSVWRYLSRVQKSLLLTLLSIFLVQTLWLLPVLNRRALAIGAGLSPDPSNHHLSYVVLEGVRSVLLLSLVSLAIGLSTKKPSSQAAQHTM